MKKTFLSLFLLLIFFINTFGIVNAFAISETESSIKIERPVQAKKAVINKYVEIEQYDVFRDNLKEEQLTILDDQDQEHVVILTENSEEIPLTYSPSKTTSLVITQGDDFLSKWNTGSSKNITLPLQASGSYNFIIDWGDGTNDKITSYNQAEVTHIYATDGIYDLNITGLILGWRFNNGGDVKKIIQISQWGNLSFGDGGGYFYGASNLVLTATDAPDLTNTTTLKESFRGAVNLGSTGSMNSWNTSTITDLSSMFQDATYFNQSIGAWDVSQVVTMSKMFYWARYFNQPIGNWNTSKVTSLNDMFNWANSFNQPIDSWDVSNVTTLNSIFWAANAFNQSLESWNVSKVTDMMYTFYGARSFNYPLASWDVSSVLYMASMFGNTDAFNQPIGNWNVSKVKTMSRMFMSAYAFNQPIGDWDVSSVVDMSEMFSNAKVFNQPIGNWTVSKVTNMMAMFMSASLFNQPIGSWVVTGVTNANAMNYMFRLATSFNQPLASWDVSGVSSMFYMFDRAYAFNQPLSSWDVSHVGSDSFGSLEGMFDGIALSTIYYNDILEQWAQLPMHSGVKFGAGNSMFGAFSQDARRVLTDIFGWIVSDGGLDLNFNQSIWFMSKWNTSLTSTGSSNENQITLPLLASGTYDFLIAWGDGFEQNITSYTQATHTYSTNGSYYITINGTIQGWQFNNNGDKLKITDIFQWGNLILGNDGAYFYGTENLALSMVDSINLIGVSNLSYMFCYSGIGETGSLNNWDTSNVLDYSFMFDHATSFNQTLDSWNVSKALTMKAMFQYALGFNQPLATWNISSVVDMSDMLSNVTLSQSYYDNLLVSWSQLSVQSNVIFNAGNSQYSDTAFSARTILMSTFGWTILDGGYQDLSKPEITGPADLTIIRGEVVQDQLWVVSDKYPKSYQLYQDGLVIASGSWSNGTINVTLSALDLGYYNFTLVLFDVQGNIAQDTFFVTVIENVPPTISSPSDVQVFVGSNVYVTWMVNDENPGTFVLTKNGSVILNVKFANGPIFTGVSSYAIGVYELNLTIYDIYGNIASDIVIVSIVESNKPSISSPVDIYYLEGSLGNSISWDVADEHPNTYEIRKNGTIIEANIWMNSTITLDIDGLTIGLYIFNISVSDSYGSENFDIVYVTVSNNPPPDVSSPEDVFLEYGTFGSYISWTLGDMNPGTYEISNGSAVLKSGLWTNGSTDISLNYFELGITTLTINVSDALGAFRIDTVMITISDTTSPTINSPSDFYFIEDTTNNNIVWFVDDKKPGTYEVLKNGTLFVKGNWNSSTITVNVNEISQGQYNFTIIVYDISGNSVSDSINIFSLDKTNPVIDSPVDVSYEEGITGNTITWHASDKHSSTYKLYKNDVLLETVVWNSDTIIISIDNLTAGIHNFKLIVYDSSNNSDSDIVQVEVIQKPHSSQTDSTSTSETNQISLSTSVDMNVTFLIVGLVIISSSRLRQKKK